MYSRENTNPVTERNRLYCIDDVRYTIGKAQALLDPSRPPKSRRLYINSIDGITATVVAESGRSQTILTILLEDLYAVVLELRKTNGR